METEDIVNELRKDLARVQADYQTFKACWNAACEDIARLQGENKRLKELYESACGQSEARRKDIITLENNYSKLVNKFAEVLLNPAMYTHKGICSKQIGPINECPVCKEK